jgi:predicted Zn-dependent protease
MLNQMKKTLLALREYTLEQGLQARLSLHREDSHLTRLANGSISLNTTESVTSLSVTAYGDRRTATATLVCGLSDLGMMRQAVDRAAAMLPHASQLSFQPSFPHIQADSVCEAGYDAALAQLGSAGILDYINAATRELEDEDLTLGGSFSVGGTAWCTLSTATPHSVGWRLSDAQITLVLASAKDKWEVNAEQSAQALDDLDPSAMHRRLAFLKEQYLTREAARLPLGPMRVVFGAAATAEYLSYLSYLGLYGSAMKQGNSIHREEDIGKQALSDKITVTEGPDCPGAFALPTDDFGRSRSTTAWYDKGVLRGFIWDQGAADEYAQTPTGHDLAHDSFALHPGDMSINGLEELAAAPRDTDILYVPYLHYTGVVSPSEGLITGTSRFGALLLKKDGAIQVPYNVRFTERLEDVFGGKLLWLSSESTVYNTSNTYGSRNPTALRVPRLMCCDRINVEISNKSY